MIKFKYNKKINMECWKRIVKAKEMFGHKFPTVFGITQKDINKAKKQAKCFQDTWNENKAGFNKGIKKIYKHSFPKEMVCYINTSPYSMDNFKKGYISVSMDCKNVATTIIHEASHFMFKKYYTKFCPNNIEDVKEIVTVINNVEFKNINDYGWKIHQEERKKAIRIWRKTNDIKKVINEIKIICQT